MHSIIVPLDGSTSSERALRAAYAIAERAGVEVIALLVRTRPDEQVDELERYLRSAVERFADSAPTSVLVVDGEPAAGILDAADRPDTLVCMASHGRAGLNRLVRGSVAEEVVRRSGAPVVVVGPNGANVPLRSERAHLVLCTDGSPAAETAIPATSSFVRSLALTCDVIHATPPDADVSLELLPAPVPVRQWAERACQQFVDELHAAGVDATPHLLFGEPAGAIAGHARATHASFVAVATHGRTGLARAALGSTAVDIVRLSPCPVLVAPANTG